MLTTDHGDKEPFFTCPKWRFIDVIKMFGPFPDHPELHPSTSIGEVHQLGPPVRSQATPSPHSDSATIPLSLLASVPMRRKARYHSHQQSRGEKSNGSLTKNNLRNRKEMRPGGRTWPCLCLSSCTAERALIQPHILRKNTKAHPRMEHVSAHSTRHPVFSEQHIINISPEISGRMVVASSTEPLHCNFTVPRSRFGRWQSALGGRWAISSCIRLLLPYFFYDSRRRRRGSVSTVTPHLYWNVYDWKTSERDQLSVAQLSLPTRTHRKSGKHPSDCGHHAFKKGQSLLPTF